MNGLLSRWPTQILVHGGSTAVDQVADSRCPVENHPPLGMEARSARTKLTDIVSMVGGSGRVVAMM